MISWRYHIVSIVAVVLAFGLGILAGSAFVDDTLVRRIGANYERALEERDEARREAALFEQFAAQLRPTLRDDRLVGREVVVVTMEGVERPTQRVVDELGAAGAEVVGTLTLTARLAVPDAPEDVEALGAIVGTTTADPVDLTLRAAAELADRLALGPSTEGDDLLAGLLDEGFVTADRDLDAAALRGVGGVTQSVVMAAGSTTDEGLPAPTALLLPMTERLVELEVPVAIAASSDDRYGFVSVVRDDPEVPDCSVVTVDHIDTVIGGIALVMGLERVFLDPDPAFRPGGDYGLDAEALVPSGEPPSSCRE